MNNLNQYSPCTGNQSGLENTVQDLTHQVHRETEQDHAVEERIATISVGHLTAQCPGVSTHQELTTGHTYSLLTKTFRE